jgi:hypothetical protein
MYHTGQIHQKTLDIIFTGIAGLGVPVFSVIG